MYKCIGLLPYSVQHVLLSFILSACTKTYDNMLSDKQQIDFLPSTNSDEFSISIVHEQYPAVWPITHRDFVQAYTAIKYDAEGNKYLVIHKSVDHSGVISKKGTIRAKAYGAILIERISPKRTKYTRIVANDMQTESAAAATYWKSVLKNRSMGLHKGLMAIQQVHFDSDQTLGILDTMHSNAQQTVFKPKEVDLSQYMKHNIKRLIYMSRASYDLTDEELTQIGQISMRNNTKVNVTGILLYCKGVFYQVLEGEVELVDQTLARIAKDNRHSKVTTVSEELSLCHLDRHFSNWSMNTVNLESISENNYFAQAAKTLIQCLDSADAFDEKTAIAALKSLSATQSIM